MVPCWLTGSILFYVCVSVCLSKHFNLVCNFWAVQCTVSYLACVFLGQAFIYGISVDLVTFPPWPLWPWPCYPDAMSGRHEVSQTCLVLACVIGMLCVMVLACLFSNIPVFAVIGPADQRKGFDVKFCCITCLLLLRWMQFRVIW